MDKRLMILGASNTQIPLVKAAKELGYYTIVVSIPGNYPGFGIADEDLYIDISDRAGVLKAAIEKKIDGITSCCLNMGIETIGYVCDKLGLVGISEKSAIASGNKLIQKELFVKNGVCTAEYVSVTNEAELYAAAEKIGLPVVVKAVDLQGSKGITIADDMETAVNGFKEAMSLTDAGYCIVEKYISGKVFGTEAFVYHGEPLFIMPNDTITFFSSTNIPIGHAAPNISDKEIMQETELQVLKAIKALGLDNCAVNTDLILHGDKVYIIEITGRSGATCLPEIVSIRYAMNYYKVLACVAVGDDPYMLFKDGKKPVPIKCAAAKMLLSEKSGTVKRIVYDHERVENDPDVYELSFIIDKGSDINSFVSCKDRIGQLIVKGNDIRECMDKLNETLKSIDIELENET